MKVAVVGATGMVGQIMLKVLEQRDFPVSELIPVASAKSIGKSVNWKGSAIPVLSMQAALDKKPHLALFSAGGATSLEWAPHFANTGCYVIDNSSAWRMHPDKKLIVPEINADVLVADDRIIANPNCSTIQMVMVLYPLHQQFTLQRVVVSTYQSVTGTGVKAVAQLENERKGIHGEMAYAYPIDKNAIPQIDVFLDNGYTKEEMKMTLETKKIMRDEGIAVSATCVRVPIIGGHSESVNAQFAKPVSAEQARYLLENTAGVRVIDNPSLLEYPMPLVHAWNQDEVFVGRIRTDETAAHTLNMWIVSDNLRKGAATNAVQIAEFLLSKKWIS